MISEKWKEYNSVCNVWIKDNKRHNDERNIVTNINQIKHFKVNTLHS